MSITATRIREINLVCVPTPDQDRAIEFYESLGFEKRTDIPSSRRSTARFSGAAPPWRSAFRRERSRPTCGRWATID